MNEDLYERFQTVNKTPYGRTLHGSQLLELEVVQEAACGVPVVEDQFRLAHLLDGLNNHAYNVQERSTKLDEDERATYLLPVARPAGLRFFFFSKAKKSSAGAAS